MGPTKGVEAVERALRIVDLCAGRTDGATLAELARDSGFYKSTILRLAVSLEGFGYVARRADGRFYPGAALLRLGQSARAAFDLEDVVRPALRALTERTRETASLYVPRGDARECLFRYEPDRAIRHIVAEGARLSCDRGASGHVITAWRGRHRAEGPDDPACIASFGERDPEVAAVALPLFDAEGAFLGALSVSGPITRFEPEAAQACFRDALIETAAALHAHGLIQEA